MYKLEKLDQVKNGKGNCRTTCRRIMIIYVWCGCKFVWMNEGVVLGKWEFSFVEILIC
jgi:hypothetical protein